MLHQELKKYQNLDRLLDQFINKLIHEEGFELKDPTDFFFLKKLADIQLEAKGTVIHIDDAINANR